MTKITQSDQKAAADYFELTGRAILAAKIRKGMDHPLVKAFAAHREQHATPAPVGREEIARIIDPDTFESIDHYADLGIPFGEPRDEAGTFKAYPTLLDGRNAAFKKADAILAALRLAPVADHSVLSANIRSAGSRLLSAHGVSPDWAEVEDFVQTLLAILAALRPEPAAERQKKPFGEAFSGFEVIRNEFATLPTPADPADAVEQEREMCARVADAKARRWRKEAARHTHKDGRRSDYEQDDLARAELCEGIAAAIRARGEG